MDRPLCFVLMPFGTKPDDAGRTVRFDAIYDKVLRPAIEGAGMEPLRADEERVGGIIHKPMFERLILCDYAIADLTTANANVFYELGVRHANRPSTTLMLFHEGSRLPFDIRPFRALPYALTDDGAPADPGAMRASITGRLQDAREKAAESPDGPPHDSPLFQLLDGYPDVDRTRTDVFRDRVEYATSVKSRLAQARTKGADAVRSVEAEIGDLTMVESGVAVDLLLSYRAVGAHNEMIRLVEAMSAPLQHTILVREQHAFALNRVGRHADAERVLTDLVDERGPSSETLGLLGRVYKDQWEKARDAGQSARAQSFLRRAIDAYRRGFEANWKDAYPGINAVTLMELADPPDPERKRIQPVVTYAAERRVADQTPDYWDYATLLEAAVLESDVNRANEVLGDALTRIEEAWQPKTTARNLRLIREAKQGRGETTSWIHDLEAALLAAEHDFTPPPLR